jgi:ferric-dicitrate binding protein FerR (iron transport regulator)
MNNIPLADALDKLAIYYNIQITCHPGLAEGKTVTALYHRHQSWKQVLQHMLFIAQLKYVIDKNGTILITH